MLNANATEICTYYASTTGQGLVRRVRREVELLGGKTEWFGG